jgi:hypothetical protein
MLLKITLDKELKVYIQNLIINVTEILFARIACVMVWSIAADRVKKADELQLFLVKFSVRK